MLAGGAGDGFEEGLEFGGIFAAGARFDAAGDVHAVGADDADRFAYIFGREATGEDDAMRLGDGAGEMPIGGGAGAAELAGLRGVNQKGCGGSKFCVRGWRSSLPHAQRLDDWHLRGHLIHDARGFIAVKLRRGKVKRAAKRDGRRRFPVNEDADGGDERRKAIDEFGGGSRGDRARTLRIEIQADGVGAELDGELGVFELGDAADFDADHGRLCLRRRGVQKYAKRDARIGGEHEVFADEKSIEASGVEIFQIVVRAQAGFGDSNAIVGNVGD